VKKGKRGALPKRQTFLAMCAPKTPRLLALCGGNEPTRVCPAKRRLIPARNPRNPWNTPFQQTPKRGRSSSVERANVAKDSRAAAPKQAFPRREPQKSVVDA
jgi:hypothetical protein